MVQFLVIGDTHYDGMPSCLPASIARKAIPSIFSQALDYANQLFIPNILITGDLFDGFPGSMEGHIEYLKFFTACEKDDIQVWVIDGNHGFKSQEDTSLKLLKYIGDNLYKNVHIFTGKPTLIKVEGSRCIFMPWPHNNAAKISTKSSLVFAHVARPNVRMPSGYNLKDAKDFNLGKHFWMIGDIHEPQEGKRFMYVGAPLQIKFGDSPNRSFVSLDYDRGQVTTKRLPIVPPYILNDIVAHTFDDLKVLDKRPANEWTKIKVSRELLVNSSKITQQYKRVIIEPLVASPKATEKEIAKRKEAFVNTFEFRTKLLDQHMKKDGLSKLARKRGILLAEKIERKVLK